MTLRDPVLEQVADAAHARSEQAERVVGLEGIGDRLDAVSGTWHVDSPRGRGTRLRAEIPCA